MFLRIGLANTGCENSKLFLSQGQKLDKIRSINYDSTYQLLDQDRKIRNLTVKIKVEFASFILDQFIGLEELVELEIARKYGSIYHERRKQKLLLLQ